MPPAGSRAAARCRTFVTVQSDIVPDRLGHTVESSRRLAEVSVRVADETGRIVQAQAGQNAAALDKNVCKAGPAKTASAGPNVSSLHVPQSRFTGHEFNA